MHYVLTNLHTREQMILPNKKTADKIRNGHPYTPYVLEKITKQGKFRVLADGSLIISDYIPD